SRRVAAWRVLCPERLRSKFPLARAHGRIAGQSERSDFDRCGRSISLSLWERGRVRVWQRTSPFISLIAKGSLAMRTKNRYSYLQLSFAPSPQPLSEGEGEEEFRNEARS